MNDHVLALLDLQGVVDTLQRHEPRRRDRAGVLEIEPPGDVRNFLGRHRNIFGIESALRIGPAI